jgi:hypothetical protein
VSPGNTTTSPSSSSASASGSGLPLRRRGVRRGGVTVAGCSFVMTRGDAPGAHFFAALMSSTVAPSGMTQNSTRPFSRRSPFVNGQVSPKLRTVMRAASTPFSLTK